MSAEDVKFLLLLVISLNFFFERLIDILSISQWRKPLPKEAEGLYEPEKYKKSKAYYMENKRFEVISKSFNFLILFSIILLGGFGWLDDFVRIKTDNPIVMALLFFGIIVILSDIISTPFSLYNTFVIEEKYGFNKTNLSTFIVDKIKGWFLGGILGGGIIAVLVWLFGNTGENFWLFAWAVIGVFLILTVMFYASLIVPLFNKMTPLEEGELKSEIEKYSQKVGFKLKNIFVIDGSKRSTKANAFFSGLGGSKTIVLYDTLIEKNSVPELVAVLAHEVGHYKKKHSLIGLFISILQIGFMLFLLSLFIHKDLMAEGLGGNVACFHMGILAFSLLYSPISVVFGIFMNMFSRKNEFEADRFAKETADGKALMVALKKLSVDHLSNINPHPLSVFVYYSHPPLIERLKALD